MAITLSAAVLNSLTITLGNESPKLEGSYSLMSSARKILAKQPFGGYSDIKLETSRDTQKALDGFIASLQKDLNSTLGLEGGE